MYGVIFLYFFQRRLLHGVVVSFGDVFLAECIADFKHAAVVGREVFVHFLQFLLDGIVSARSSTVNLEGIMCVELLQWILGIKYVWCFSINKIHWSLRHSASQSINQSIDQPINQPMNWSMKSLIERLRGRVALYLFRFFCWLQVRSEDKSRKIRASSLFSDPLSYIIIVSFLCKAIRRIMVWRFDSDKKTKAASNLSKFPLANLPGVCSECLLCSSFYLDATLAPCGHVFCWNCAHRWFNLHVRPGSAPTPSHFDVTYTSNEIRTLK